jgi:hypothetical protein
VRTGSAGAVKSAVVVGAAADAAVVVERLGQLGRTVSQHWLEIGLREGVVGLVGGVACCEGRDGGGFEQKGAGRTSWMVVQGT